MLADPMTKHIGYVSKSLSELLTSGHWSLGDKVRVRHKGDTAQWEDRDTRVRSESGRAGRGRITGSTSMPHVIACEEHVMGTDTPEDAEDGAGQDAEKGQLGQGRHNVYGHIQEGA